MTDERALELLALLGEYARTSTIKEGTMLAEVASWTIGSVAADIVQTTPQHLEYRLDADGVLLSDAN